MPEKAALSNAPVKQPLSLSQKLSLGLLLLALLSLPLLMTGSVLVRQDRQLQDYLQRLRAAQQVPSRDIVVVDIDEGSLEAMQGIAGRWPWPRSVHAELVEFLLLQEPSAIAFDILFSEPDVYRPDADAYFAEVLRSTDRVYLPLLEQPAATGSAQGRTQDPLLSSYPPILQIRLASELLSVPEQKASAAQRSKILTPLALPVDTWRGGSINFSADEDGIGRRYDVWRALGAWRLLSLPARIAEDRGRDLPTQPSFIVDWQSTALHPYTRLTYAQLYGHVLGVAEGAEPWQAGDFFKDKVIVIGVSASGLHDLRATPIDPLYPGLSILATAIDNLLQGHALEVVAVRWHYVLTILLLVLIAWALHKQRLFTAAALGLGAFISLPVLAYVLVMQGWLLRIMPTLAAIGFVLLGALLLQYLLRQRELQHTMAVFKRVLDPQVVKQLVAEHGSDELLANKHCRITVLFSDIRNFTSISEQHSADEVMTMLYHYFNKEVGVIFKHGGTLDKFIGDALMAFWGAPLDDPEQERHAIEAALAMVEKMQEFKREFGFADFDIGIGIHSGDAVVGLLGSEQRVDYTAIGDTVNLASRIEGLTKGRARILVSKQTKEACEGLFEFVEHGKCKVKGRDKSVQIFQPKRLLL